MYNLAKFLTEEPKKLELLLIRFIKLLIALHVTGMFFGYTWKLDEMIESPIPSGCTALQIIYFLISVISTWLILWILLAETICYDVLMWLFTRKANTRKTLLGVLEVLGVVKVAGERITGVKRNITRFYDFLEEYNEVEPEIHDVRKRIKEYYLLILVTFILLLATEPIGTWSMVWGSWLLLNAFIGCVIANRVYKHINKNTESLKREFGVLAYSQRITDAIKEIRLFENYEKPTVERKMVLKRTSGYGALPQQVKIVAAYHWNLSLGQRFMQILLRENFRRGKHDEERYIILMTNFDQQPEAASLIKSIPNLALITAKTDEEIFNGLEERIHIVSKARSKLK